MFTTLRRILFEAPLPSLTDRIEFHTTTLSAFLGISGIAAGIYSNQRLVIWGNQLNYPVCFRKQDGIYLAQHVTLEEERHIGPHVVNVVTPVNEKKLEGTEQIAAETTLLDIQMIIAAYMNRLCLDILKQCITYAKKRQTFGVPIYKHQMVADAIVIGASELEGNVLTLLEWGESMLEEIESSERIKRLAQVSFLIAQLPEIADRIVPVMGAYGISADEWIKSKLLEVHHLSSIRGESYV